MLTIQNEYLRLTVDPHGAQMMELATGKGTQLLWGGDAKYWADRAPVLFPFVGRLTGGQYRLHGKVYPMSSHGFAAASEFSVLEQSADAVTLALRDNEETLRQYPLHFEFLVRYALHRRELEIGYTVRNPNAIVCEIILITGNNGNNMAKKFIIGANATEIVSAELPENIDYFAIRISSWNVIERNTLYFRDLTFVK